MYLKLATKEKMWNYFDFEYKALNTTLITNVKHGILISNSWSNTWVSEIIVTKIQHWFAIYSQK